MWFRECFGLYANQFTHYYLGYAHMDCLQSMIRYIDQHVEDTLYIQEQRDAQKTHATTHDIRSLESQMRELETDIAEISSRMDTANAYEQERLRVQLQAAVAHHAMLLETFANTTQIRLGTTAAVAQERITQHLFSQSYLNTLPVSDIQLLRDRLSQLQTTRDTVSVQVRSLNNIIGNPLHLPPPCSVARKASTYVNTSYDEQDNTDDSETSPILNMSMSK